MKRYMLEIKLDGTWTPVYLCATKAEAIAKVQRWEGPARIKEVSDAQQTGRDIDGAKG